MHYEVIQFIKRVRKEYPHKFRLRKVLEVGSKNINGSPRKYFWFCDYVGVDLSSGKGVDVVMNFTDSGLLKLPTFSYDIVISTEVLEHCEKWGMCLRRMYGLLKSGGLMIMTCASEDRLPHGTNERHPEASPDTNEYYRNISKEDFKSVLPPELFDSYVLMNGRDKQDLYFYGIKK